MFRQPTPEQRQVFRVQSLAVDSRTGHRADQPHGLRALRQTRPTAVQNTPVVNVQRS